MNLIVKTTVLGATLFMAGTLTAAAVNQPAPVDHNNNTKNSIVGGAVLSLDNFVYKFNNESKAVVVEIVSWFDSNANFVTTLSTSTTKFIFNKFSDRLYNSAMQSEKFLSFENNLFNQTKHNLNSAMLSTYNQMEVVDEKILAYFSYSQNQFSRQNDMLLISVAADIKNSNINLKSNFAALKNKSNIFLDNSDVAFSNYVIPDLKQSSDKFSKINNYFVSTTSGEQAKLTSSFNLDTTIDSAKVLVLEINNLMNSTLDIIAYKVDSVTSLAVNSNIDLLDRKLPIGFSSNASYLHEEILATNDRDYYFEGKVLGVNTEPKLVDKLVANIFGNRLTDFSMLNY